jgi:Lipase maturation factor
VLAAVYVIAFAAVVFQFRPLLGEHGFLPVPAFVARRRFRDAPSLFQLRYSDGLAMAVGVAGIVVAALLLFDLPQQGPIWLPMLAWFVLWALYLSVVNVGQIFYGFGWESLLLETGALAVFLGNAETAPPILVVVLVRWLLFRVEFGAGLIKIRGDDCWRRLTCLDYHHETQPMPGPFSWHFHRLPASLHRVEVVANHAAQLVVPWLLFAPQPVAGVAGAIIIVTQLWLVASGNFAWLNALTITLALFAFDNRWLAPLLPIDPPAQAPAPTLYAAVVLAAAAGVVVLSYWPARNLLSSHQAMNASFNRWHLVNAYGAFGSVTRERREVIVEGTADTDIGPDTVWLEYEFKGKPGDPHRRPRQWAPYHLRLDWLMWFAALSPAYADRWFVAFLRRLAAGDEATLRLLRRNPFPERPPALVRARLYHYRFTTRAERQATGDYWVRERLADYAGPVGAALRHQ